LERLGQYRQSYRNMRVSVSQIKNFRLCPTKWYISSVLKIREPEKGAVKLGKYFHEAAELYLKGNDPVPTDSKIGNMLENSKPLLSPYLDKDIIIEKEIKGELCEGIDYIGYIDIWDPIKKEVTDIKTGNPDYFLTEYQLPGDFQLNLYAHHEFTVNEEALDPTEYTLTHIQQSTKSPYRASKITSKVDSTKFHKIWSDAQETAKDMKSVKDNVKDLPWEDIDQALHKEKGACSKFGGCPYREICWSGVDPEYVRKQFKEEEMLPENHPFTKGNSEMSNSMTFKEKIAKAKGETIVIDESTEHTKEQQEAVAAWSEDEDTIESPPPEPAKKKRGRPRKEEVVTHGNPWQAEVVTQDGHPGWIDTERASVQFCIGAIPFKSGIQITPFSEILKPFEESMAEKFKLTDIRQDKWNEPIKALCNMKKEIMEKCKEFEYIFVDERDPVQDMLFRCLDWERKDSVHICAKDFSLIS